MEYVPLEQRHQQIICPFCRGNEDEAPAAIASWLADGTRMVGADDPASWAVRLIPNKFPSLSDESGPVDCGPWQSLSQDGIQELIIPTPRHVTSISELSVQELAVSFHAAQTRIAELDERERLKHLMLFMNCRMAAGASLEHIHMQLMGSPVVSPYLAQRAQRNEENIRDHGQPLVASLLNWELQQQTRILRESENFVMLCPFASRFSFQVWIVPRKSELPFSDRLIDFNAELAGLCRTYIRKLEQILEHPAYNMLLNLAPTQDRDKDHWFIEIFPRLNHLAGYELGTGIWVNPVAPETAVKLLAS